MNKTPIEWADYSWPIVNGCRRISPGCGGAEGGGCYAERLAATRLAHTPKYAGLARMTANGPRWSGEARLHEADLLAPLRLRKPSRIFVADMGDLFFDGVPDDVIDRVFAVMAQAPRHTFQVLTKRPDRMRKYFAAWPNGMSRGHHIALHIGNGSGPTVELPLPNVWLGVSVEDQKRADERIPLLLDTPAAVRFLSCEPLLGSIRFADVPGFNKCGSAGVELLRNLWVIVGGESGPGARPCDVAWIRSIVEQCRGANVPVFVKQLGAHVIDRNDSIANGTPQEWPDDTDVEDCGDPSRQYQGAPCRILLANRKGGEMAEWPRDLRVREFPRKVRA